MLFARRFAISALRIGYANGFDLWPGLKNFLPRCGSADELVNLFTKEWGVWRALWIISLTLIRTMSVMLIAVATFAIIEMVRR